MIPALIVLYILLLGLTVGGSWAAIRLRQRHAPAFLKPFHFFIVAAFAYAILGFIGEVLAPAILTIPARIPGQGLHPDRPDHDPPVGGGLRPLLRRVERLLGRRFAPPLQGGVLGNGSALSGRLPLPVPLVFHPRQLGGFRPGDHLNGILLLLVAAAVLSLLLGAPAEDDPGRRRLARGLGRVYAVSFAVLGFVLVAAAIGRLRESRAGQRHPGRADVPGQFPALAYRGGPCRHVPIPEPATHQPRLGIGRTPASRLGEEGDYPGWWRRGWATARSVERLFISPKTVKNHMTSIYAKTGARNRVQLANRLNRRGGDPPA